MVKKFTQKIFDYDVLILLMGTNPLPNYVVAKYFNILNENKIKKLLILHSEHNPSIGQQGTFRYADRLKEIIESELQKKDNAGKENRNRTKIVFQSLRDVGSSEKIKKDISSSLRRLKKECKEDAISVPSIHLNYTGGTKAMAVHAYQSVKEKFPDNSSFSYLDARQFKIVFDDDRNWISEDLRAAVSIDYETLIKLHLYQKHGDSDGQMKPDWLANWNGEGVLDKLSDLMDNDNINLFLDDYKEYIRKFYYKENKFIRSVRKFNANVLDQCGSPDKFRNNLSKKGKGASQLLMELLEIIPEDYSISSRENGSVKLWYPDDRCTNNKYKERAQNAVADFLDGKWLEHYVWMVISQEIQRDEDVKRYEKNLFFSSEISKINGNDPGNSGKEFEIDVILLNGYQVCGISVTTSIYEGLCKLKGFEILHRVSQFGGDEARAILVTLLNNDGVDRVQEDIDSVTLTGRLKVLGAEDVKKDRLWKMVKKHVWEV